MEAAILTEGLTKRFGAHVAVDGVSLEVPQGEVFGFLGPNGAGKTTTIAMLLGLVRPTAGRALLFGHDVQRAPEAALHQVGAMVEAPAFYPYLSGRDNLRVLARAGGLPERRVDEALAAVDLAPRARDRFRTYSQGMRQRLGIAAALLPDPRLIILDEPTNGLDPAGQQEIRALIRGLAGEGRTFFLSSHLLHEVEQLCERVAILKQGRVIAQGRVADLLRRGRGVLVRVAGDAARAAEILRGLEWVAGVVEREGALLVDAPTARAAEINALLTSRALPVAEIRAYEERLEDFFLEVTRP
ncbi:MAG TPA: ABC transporter ATP-binding protein [Roseiflexaceae bacterium]|nr:ABC transporter ATP-binding protein [Roseiflexaceae bacterium]